jgi:mono/diheme cytochrome c family protein
MDARRRAWPLALGLVALFAGAAHADDAASAARGRQLFVGEAPLAARIVGQDFALAPEAGRCINCHGATAGPAGPRASAAGSPADLAAPVLSAATLTATVRRRGGPPSRYDAAALCTLLRTGVDPAHVMILRTMPRYEINDADCRSLWLHLTTTPR